ncbi:sensor histidine kinase [Demequina activiva]|uniref:histidine kinase n=1 Tax=Demequina activiva TaxID=1582364 RepID=A0A919UGD4_9MICO|nr:histidine kinase [Demequina activiva]GIG54339.1 hypothetical protein Dac01nite_10910 [Demequina activiva]
MTFAPRAPERRDVTLSATVTALALAMLLLLPALSSVDPETAITMPRPGDWQWWFAVLAVIVQGARLAWLSSAPGHVLVAMGALALAVAAVGLGDASSVPLLAVIAASYAATRHRSSGETGVSETWTPWAITAALTAAAGAIANLRLDEGALVPVAAAVAQAVVVVGVPTGIAAAVNARAQVRTSREREATALAGELEARTEAALAAERTAIARELHDIAAHHLSGIALMSSAISQQIDTDPATAKQGLADVRAQTRTLLDELRGLVALLRQDGDVSTAVESLAGLETLVPEATQRGRDVELRLPQGASVRDLAHGIGPLSQFAAYRTVQEALANAARHAPGGRCAIELRDAGDALEVVVTNGPGSAGAETSSDGPGGFGLRGMEERAALTRSALTYGPTEDGGWRVRLSIPRETAPTPVAAPASDAIPGEAP